MLIFLLILFIISNIESRDQNIIEDEHYKQECNDKIHKQCLNKIIYNEKDLENVRLYLIQRFGNTNPLKPMCKQLYVRKDIKCLTNDELSELIDGFKELFRTGVYDKYSSIHANNWPAVHKFPESMVWHRWHIRQLEKELQNVNPKLSMPYWDFHTEFAEPEKSRIWDIFGTVGNQNNSFCIPDGPFVNISVNYPNRHCIRCEWNRDGSINPWEPPEWITSVMQTTKKWVEFATKSSYTRHFKAHLNIGGYNGDFSVPWAPNDPVFYLFHVYETDLLPLKWQLSDDSNLVPQSYNNYPLPHSNERIFSNIETDVFTYFTNTRVKEGFQLGFGDLCYIHDQLIQPINNKIDQDQVIAIRILMESLPSVTLKRYFPKFADNTFTVFDHIFSNIGNCMKPKLKCKPIPIVEPYNTTANGLRQLERFRFDGGMDLTAVVYRFETLYYNFMKELKQNNYCSIYVI